MDLSFACVSIMPVQVRAPQTRCISRAALGRRMGDSRNPEAHGATITMDAGGVRVSMKLILSLRVRTGVDQSGIERPDVDVHDVLLLQHLSDTEFRN